MSGMATKIRRGWDRPGVTACANAECSNDRAPTVDGVASVYCSYHRDQWTLRLSRLASEHPGDPGDPPDATPRRNATTPVFTPPPPSMVDAGLCARCHLAPRDFPDNLCEDCRRGR